MAQSQVKKIEIIHQSKLSFKEPTSVKFGDGFHEPFHYERDGSSIKLVSDGIIDSKKEIEAQKNNAGLVNILKLQELRYGSVENAIARNKDKQVFADVSNIPTSVAEQREMVQNANQEIDALCAKLGVSREELLNMTQESLASALAPKQEDGGVE